jgi:hypothetical protein
MHIRQVEPIVHALGRLQRQQPTPLWCSSAAASSAFVGPSPAKSHTKFGRSLSFRITDTKSCMPYFLFIEPE